MNCEVLKPKSQLKRIKGRHHRSISNRQQDIQSLLQNTKFLNFENFDSNMNIDVTDAEIQLVQPLKTSPKSDNFISNHQVPNSEQTQKVLQIIHKNDSSETEENSDSDNKQVIVEIIEPTFNNPNPGGQMFQFGQKRSQNCSAAPVKNRYQTSCLEDDQIFIIQEQSDLMQSCDFGKQNTQGSCYATPSVDKTSQFTMSKKASDNKNCNKISDGFAKYHNHLVFQQPVFLDNLDEQFEMGIPQREARVDETNNNYNYYYNQSDSENILSQIQKQGDEQKNEEKDFSQPNKFDKDLDLKNCSTQDYYKQLLAQQQKFVNATQEKNEAAKGSSVVSKKSFQKRNFNSFNIQESAGTFNKKKVQGEKFNLNKFKKDKEYSQSTLIQNYQANSKNFIEIDSVEQINSQKKSPLANITSQANNQFSTGCKNQQDESINLTNSYLNESQQKRQKKIEKFEKEFQTMQNYYEKTRSIKSSSFAASQYEQFIKKDEKKLRNFEKKMKENIKPVIASGLSITNIQNNKNKENNSKASSFVSKIQSTSQMSQFLKRKHSQHKKYQTSLINSKNNQIEKDLGLQQDIDVYQINKNYENLEKKVDTIEDEIINFRKKSIGLENQNKNLSCQINHLVDEKNTLISINHKNEQRISELEQKMWQQQGELNVVKVYLEKLRLDLNSTAVSSTKNANTSTVNVKNNEDNKKYPFRFDNYSENINLQNQFDNGTKSQRNLIKKPQLKLENNKGTQKGNDSSFSNYLFKLSSTKNPKKANHHRDFSYNYDKKGFF